MSEGLDATLVLPGLGEKPSKQYRTSPYTVEQYSALPYAQHRAVNAECDACGQIRVYRTHLCKIKKTLAEGSLTAQGKLLHIV